MNSAAQWRNAGCAFLSCLFGSERIQVIVFNGLIFLSCLFGSELFGNALGLFGTFLSCLFGSELFIAANYIP